MSQPPIPEDMLRGLIERVVALEAQNEALREAIVKIESGVKLMVPEPQKSGFLEITRAALAATEKNSQS